MGGLLNAFEALPLLAQVGIIVGVLTPLLVLYSYLNPPPPPERPPPPKTFSVSGDVRIQEKKKKR